MTRGLVTRGLVTRGHIAVLGDREVWPTAILHLPLALHEELPQGGEGQEGRQHGEGRAGEDHRLHVHNLSTRTSSSLYDKLEENIEEKPTP